MRPLSLNPIALPFVGPPKAFRQPQQTERRFLPPSPLVIVPFARSPDIRAYRVGAERIGTTHLTATASAAAGSPEWPSNLDRNKSQLSNPTARRDASLLRRS